MPELVAPAGLAAAVAAVACFAMPGGAADGRSSCLHAAAEEQ
jgi:hypothetical protein